MHTRNEKARLNALDHHFCESFQDLLGLGNLPKEERLFLVKSFLRTKDLFDLPKLPKSCAALAKFVSEYNRGISNTDLLIEAVRSEQKRCWAFVHALENSDPDADEAKDVERATRQFRHEAKKTMVKQAI